MRRIEMLIYVAGVIASAIYILNPTAGIWEILPDNLPVVGNLDEAAMAAILIGCLRRLRRLRSERLEAPRDVEV